MKKSGEVEPQLGEIAAELSSALARERAMTQVLRVMSASPGDSQPVFDAIVAACSELFEGSPVTLWLLRDGVLKSAGRAGSRPGSGQAAADEIPLDRRAVIGACVIEARTLHCPDLSKAVDEYPLASGTLARGYRSLMVAPLLRDGSAIGCINVLRTVAAPFSTRELVLLSAFADQASIAIEMERQARELADFNRTLQVRVAEGVAELARTRELARFLPPQVSDLVLSGGGRELLRHHRREIVAVFADLRGFTAFAETADPEEVMNVLNGYYAAMGAVIQRHGGTLDAYAGDGIMAFLNDPVPIPDFVPAAARMSIEMHSAFDPLSAGWRRRGYDLRLGIGMAQGYATMGTIGFEGRWDYGAIGTVCNLAARLCSEAKGGEILVSQRMVAGLGGAFDLQPAGDLVLKGFARPVPAFRLSAGPLSPRTGPRGS